MQDYYINPKIVYGILAAKGVQNLFHANTLLTSLTFINNRALLSRGFVERGELVQTEQKSDSEDKKFNVWDDVFLDGLDLHKKYQRANKYGPILFVIKLELLLAPSLPPLLVTRNNPLYWKDNDAWDDRYFRDSEEINKHYLSGGLDSRIMFTFRSPDAFIKLNKYLRGILIDKPPITVNIKDGSKQNIGHYAHNKILVALENNGLSHIPVKFRHENEHIYFCACTLNYSFMNHLEFYKRYKC